MKTLICLVLSIIVTSCSQRSAQPELVDPIYKDLMAELDLVGRNLELEEKNLDRLVKEKSLAVPQTGQIKFANKKIADSNEKIIILRQQKKFFEISLFQRAEETRRRLQESLQPGGRPWPDPEEIHLYKSIAKFQREKISREKTNGTKKSVPRGTIKTN